MALRMQALELKIPPPAVAVLIAGAMWGISSLIAAPEVPVLARAMGAIVIALTGAGISLAGVVSFRRARTTLNPMKPETASALVCSGIYKITRNPMYLGLALVLFAWAVYLSSVWTLVGPCVFVLYIDRFQIIPEERTLSAIFGAEYDAYRLRVRRWL